MSAITVEFISADGATTTIATGKEGDSLLAVAQNFDQPLEGTCEGQMACSTCHVIIDAEDFEKLPTAVEMEEDILDLAVGARRTSRLACQIILKKQLDGLKVRIPEESHDIQRM